MKRLALILAMVSPIVQAEEKLIGGEPAARGQFPEVVYIRSGNARCSATVIGPKVILTAGHCVKEGGDISNVDFVIDQIVFQAKCHLSPDYRARQVHDMALCVVSREIDVAYASVGVAQAPKLGEQVQLSGYGCIKPGGGGGNDGTLRVGLAKVSKLPAGTDYWFYTKDKAALCFGDSGGPAFSKIDKQGHHYVIGVNSRGNIQDLSLLTALYIPKSLEFFRAFEAEHGVKICGIGKVCDQVSSPNDQCSRLKVKAEKYLRRYDECRQTRTMEFIEGVQE